ncbi:hypothetical protein ACFWMR_07455, partial [Amycolatopsis thailandensis]|uniref:hypothetical protein n=1 Tax=Amycolatopsis thailandensis TaxID=589330 RepID=UPI0036575E73
LGDRHGEGTAWNNLGNALRALRRFDDAARAWGEAVAAYDDAGDGELAAQLREWLGKFDTDGS